MKKILSLILALTMAVGLAACGSAEAPAEETTEGTEAGEGREDDGGGDGVASSEHAQGHNLGGDGGTDVRAIYNGGCLAQGDDAGVHEAYGHHRGGAGTLDGCGADGSYAHSEEFAFGCFGEKFFKPAGAG